MAVITAEHVEVDGHPVAFLRTEDEGPPLLLLHGAGGNAEIWRPLLQVLGGFEALAVSFPGRDGSAGTAHTTAHEAAAWVLRFLEGIGRPEALLLGHSYGGAVAIEAAFASSALSGLVLAASGARLRVHPKIMEAARDAQKSGERLSPRFSFGEEAKEAAIERYERAAASTPVAATVADWTACNAFDRMGQLGTLTLPTLVVSGGADPLTPPKYGRFLVETLPRATLEELPGAGHMFPFERPEVLAPLVRTWAAAVLP